MSQGNDKGREGTVLSRRSFLASSSAALTAVALTGNAEGQEMEQTVGWDKSLNGKVAVITGAARGIGREVAVAFARSGAHLVGIDICATVDPRSGVNPATIGDLEETGALVKKLGASWKSIVLDQRDLPKLRAAASDIDKEFGRIDILFANAGIQAFRPLLEMEDADWHIQIDVNLTGTANAVRAFGPYMLRQGSGRIIMTTSTQGRHGMFNGSAYSASKWGIIGLMKSAAMDLGRHGITVNCLVPGLIDTPLTRHEERYEQAIQVAGRTPTGDVKVDEEVARKILQGKSPLGIPWIDPVEMAPVVYFSPPMRPVWCREQHSM
jgi:NAD(P)-dependent dehydrogenase (short-subunit alcohol dehydrogenase family)